ncbi:T9SS type A sorting domain-containing protein [Flavobacterium sp.]|uniref:T9SS type A sorting domain-containing protein n=1 Tax=Flavobacterium sp. TaxID=239 RepID=UPI002486D9A6|nr:T9SS type A sorting domain-containing protein [Flavobacterium sp.]MDI1317713.1 T9SS type A sorting domain-containing protein [Flavobacterium sp.]
MNLFILYRVFIYPTCNKDFVFKVKARNGCGWSDWFEVVYTMNNCSSECSDPFNGIVGNNFILTPNPVSEGLLNITVKYEAPWFTTINNNPVGNVPSLDLGIGNLVTNYNPIVTVTIFNQSGSLLLTFPNTALPELLNIGNLPQGTYLVLIEYQGQLESYTIIKE